MQKVYERNPNCECSTYKDFNTLSIEERVSRNTKYWKEGFIYENDSSQECNCHKVFRLGGRYDRFANQKGLPSYSELSKLPYLGQGNAYNKLKEIPEIVMKNNIKDLLVYVHGGDGCQKTTSLSKLLYSLILKEQSVDYMSFSEIIEKYMNNDETLQEFCSADWIVIDDCFEGETVNFKNTYNQFYNFILKRKKPVILATVLSKEEVLNNTNKPYFNSDMLKKVFRKVDKYNSYIEFKDNIDKIKISDKEIDLWNY